MLKHIIDQILAIIPFLIGWYWGVNHKSKIADNKKYFHKCLYCKHYCNKGKPTYSNFTRGFCMHPDNAEVSPLDPTPANHYCGKFELTEQYGKELFKIQSEKILKKNINEPKIINKN